MFDTLKLKSTYSTYEDDIGQDFYTPVLSQCIAYDRATAYFSAKALSNYAQGLEVFSGHGHKYRLIISSEVNEKEYNEIVQGYALRRDIKKILIDKLNESLTMRDKCNLSNLAYFISVGTIDIKMAFTKRGIFHDKFGVLKDANNNIICFRGSNNETDAAFQSNYESFDITCSWQSSEFDYKKITKSMETFEKLWVNKTTGVHVCDMDSVIRNKILSYNKGQIIMEPVLLEEDCLILDLPGRLELSIKIDPAYILNNRVYKLRLKRYVDTTANVKNRFIFKEGLTYPKFKKIIDILKQDSIRRDYKFYVTDRLQKYIEDRELYIRERARVGLAVKSQDLEGKLLAKFTDYKAIVDSCMVRKLRNKQMWDSFFMYTMRKVNNFSVPGSGKTASVLGVFSFLESQGIVEKIVMIGPKNSFGSWTDEFYECFGDRKKLKPFSIQSYLTLIEKRRAVSYDTGGKNLLLFNYESLSSIHTEVKKLINSKTLLVFDEVHKVKAIGGQRASDALNVSEEASYIIAMTGTPIPNSYIDIKNILHILYRDEYHDFFGFTDSQLKSPSPMDIEEINDKLQPFFCRTTKKQLMVPLANDDFSIKIMASSSENELFNILLMKYAKNKFALIIRLLQLESNPKMLLKSIDNGSEDFSDILYTLGEVEDVEYKDYSKEVTSLINSIDQTRKFKGCVEQVLHLFKEDKSVIIWCIFVDSINRISQTLEKEGVKTGCIHGSVNNQDRTAILEDFKNKSIDVLITNPHTLAESISLHSVCHDAVYFEYSYNLVHLLQSKDRIHRLGLPENQYTQYYYLQNIFTKEDGYEYSLDEKIYHRLLEKEKIMLDAIEHNILEPVFASDEDIDLIFDGLGL